MPGADLDPVFESAADDGWIRDALKPSALVGRVEDAFTELESGRLLSIPRAILADSQGNRHGVLFGIWEGRLGVVKAFSVITAPPNQGVRSSLLLLTPTGSLIGSFEAAWVTERRTAAVSALSAMKLAQNRGHNLALIGAGPQAHEHLIVLDEMMEIDSVRVWSRTYESARALAEASSRSVSVCAQIEDALADATLVVVATSAASPILTLDMLNAGVHLISVGGHPPAGELSSNILEKCRVFVDAPYIASPLPVGAPELQMAKTSVVPLSAVVAGRRDGRLSDVEITVYKSIGHVAADLAVGSLLLDALTASAEH